MPDAPDRPSVETIAVKLDNYCDLLTSAFQEELQKIVLKASAKTTSRLRGKLDIDDKGIVRRTAKNAKLVRKADNVFSEQMDAAGYQHLVNGFVANFNGTIPFFHETANAITATWKNPPPPIEFNQRDYHLFGQAQLSAKQSLSDVVDSIGTIATQRATFTIGGLPFDELAGALAQQFGKTISQATGIAATALPTFYRTVADEGFKEIEQSQDDPVYYTYQGPDDKLTRPFCVRLVESGKAYSRKEIEAMNNGQLPNVMRTCGGYLCRHQWVLYVPKAAKHQA